MKRPPIAASCWLFIFSGIAPVLCALSALIGTSQAPNAHVNPGILALKSVLTPDSGTAALWSATPSGALIDTYHPAIIETGESKSSCSVPELAFLKLDGPRKAVSSAHPLLDDSPSRIVTLPLRC